jgi:steroid delta-isomerase-like uncharacterized protein
MPFAAIPLCRAAAGRQNAAMFKTIATVFVLAAAVIPAAPQTPPAGRQRFTLSGNMLRGYAALQRNLLEAAELMPEEHYSFKPTAETRPYGRLGAHIALSQFGGCAALKGDSNPKASDKEETARSKADLVALLKASSAYCDPVLNALTDEAMVQLTKIGANEVAKGLVLASTNTHGNEMYGTMAVYLRLKGLVPPTTARQPPPTAPAQKGDDPQAVVDRLYTAYRSGDVEALVNLLSADIVFEDPTFRLKQVGREGMRQMTASMRATYSDITVDVHSLIVQGDTVAAEVTMGGVITRADGATRRISVRGASFFHVRDGQIVSWTDYFDFQTFNEQTRKGT